MPTNSNRRPTYNAGQAILESDLDDSIGQAQQLDDYKIGLLTRTDPAVSVPWSEANYLAKLHRFHGQAYAAPGGSARQIVNSTAGTIAQWIGSPVGASEPQLLFYHCSANEISATVAVGDATNPRYDLICIKLEYEAATPVSRDFKDGTTGVVSSQSMSVSRNVKMTVQVVAGTPAGSPVLPAIPAGYAVYCIVRVPATFNTTFSALTTGTNEFRDCCYPIGPLKRAYRAGMEMIASSTFTKSVTGGGTLVSSAASEIAWFPAIEDTHGEAKILSIQPGITTGETLEYGVKDTTFAFSVYGSYSTTSGITTSMVDLASFGAHSHRFHYRNWLQADRVPTIKITTTAISKTINYIVVYYK